MYTVNILGASKLHIIIAKFYILQAITGLTPSKDVPQQTSEQEDFNKQPENKVAVAEKDKQPEAVPKQKGKKDKAKGKVTFFTCNVSGKTTFDYIDVLLVFFCCITFYILNRG